MLINIIKCCKNSNLGDKFANENVMPKLEQQQVNIFGSIELRLRLFKLNNENTIKSTSVFPYLKRISQSNKQKKKPTNNKKIIEKEPPNNNQIVRDISAASVCTPILESTRERRKVRRRIGWLSINHRYSVCSMQPLHTDNFVKILNNDFIGMK